MTKKIMKKTLAAVAVLGAFAGSALAADVTLYGKVDLGFHYTHEDVDGVKSDNWSMESGQNSASRFGLKGTEDLGNGYTVGFQLEHGFSADKQEETKLFSREMRLYVKSGFGEVGMGRFGALDSTTGSYGLIGGITATTGIADVADVTLMMENTGRLANSIVYKSPKFAGVQLHAMASLGGEDDNDEATHKTERYYGVAATYDVDAFHSALIVSQTDYADEVRDAGADNELKVTAGASYDFGVTKAFVAGQYFDNAAAAYTAGHYAWANNGKKTGVDATLETVPEWTEQAERTDLGYKGYGIVIGAKTPVFGGSLITQVGYGEAEEVSDSAKESKAWNVGAIYEYSLSKRTIVYGALGYDYAEDADKSETKHIQAGFGMIHNF